MRYNFNQRHVPVESAARHFAERLKFYSKCIKLNQTGSSRLDGNAGLREDMFLPLNRFVPVLTFAAMLTTAGVAQAQVNLGPPLLGIGAVVRLRAR